jgi:hypothetical protein
MGSVAPVTNLAQKEWTSGSLTGEIGYQSLCYLLASVLKTVTPSTPAGATLQRLWSYKPANFAPDAFSTFTMEKGSTAGAERTAYTVFNNLGMTINRTTAEITSDILGQAMAESITMTGSPTDIPALPADPRSFSVYLGNTFSVSAVQTLAINAATGTYVLTYDGLSTTAIAVGATTAAVETALSILPNIGANNVTVTGTPGTSYTITFSGALAGVQVSPITISAFTGGPPTITQTTQGGLTKLLRDSSVGLTIPDRYNPQFTVNQSDPSFSYLTQNGIEPTGTLVLEHDSVSAALMADLRARTTKYLRLVSLGPTVETVATEPYLNSLVITAPVRLTESDRSDVDGAWSSTYSLGLIYDPTFAGFLQVDITNGLAAL